MREWNRQRLRHQPSGVISVSKSPLSAYTFQNNANSREWLSFLFVVFFLILSISLLYIYIYLSFDHFLSRFFSPPAAISDYLRILVLKWLEFTIRLLGNEMASFCFIERPRLHWNLAWQLHRRLSWAVTCACIPRRFEILVLALALTEVDTSTADTEDKTA